MKKYINSLTLSKGVITVGHTNSGRCRKLTDLWFRLKFFFFWLPQEYRNQARPFRLSKSLRASLALSLAFDKNVLHLDPPSSTPTSSVGNDGEYTVSP